MSGKMFYGGVPTAADIALIERVITPIPNMDVPAEQIAKIIGTDVKDSRFRSVTTQWRKKVFREKHLRCIMEGGVFHFCNADEATSAVVKDFQKIGRLTGRTVTHVEAINEPEVSKDNLSLLTIARRNAHILLDAAQTACKTIAKSKPVASLVGQV